MNFMFELQEQLISRVSTTNKWDIVLATGTWNSYLWANELCSFYFIDILTMVFLKIFQRFLTHSKDFQKFSKTCLQVTQSLLDISEISEDQLKVRKTQICFNHTLTNLSTALIPVKSWISSEDMENIPPESWIWFCMNFLCFELDTCFLQIQLEMEQLKISDWTPPQWISFWQWVVQF